MFKYVSISTHVLYIHISMNIYIHIHRYIYVHIYVQMHV